MDSILDQTAEECVLLLFGNKGGKYAISVSCAHFALVIVANRNTELINLFLCCQWRKIFGMVLKLIYFKLVRDTYIFCNIALSSCNFTLSSLDHPEHFVVCIYYYTLQIAIIELFGQIS